MQDHLSTSAASGSAAPIHSGNAKLTGKVLAAAFLSAVLPGAGHLLLKRWVKGIVFLLVLVSLCLLYWPYRLPNDLYDVALTLMVRIGLGVLAVWDVLYARKRPDARPSAWLLAYLLPLTLVTGVFHTNRQLRIFGFQAYSIPSVAMSPTVPLNGFVITDRWAFEARPPRRGDITVCAQPRQPNVTVVKRVIAVGGDEIEIRGDTTIVNGRVISEPYVWLDGPMDDGMYDVAPMKIPSGKLFVMGDNRRKSLDSRFPDLFGLADVKGVRGKVIYVQPSLLSPGKRIE